ncbi:uncharacterized protein LOC113351177 [Papaver somniferum]|uniref:uncharacterized protein LOC113351177 n=1 Tax=Papaver somniferum TaxID=3469 RepID=UPI000E6F5BCE|nr:uncharacterized protein LOC113351177 [Papaver somniferum]
MIHCLINSDPSKLKWLLSCVYGSPYPQEKKEQWNFLQNICENFDITGPWALIGDLNLTLHDNERSNSNGFSSHASSIAQVVLETGLNDLGFHGNPYTWTSNKHGTDLFPNNFHSSKNWKFFECWLREGTCTTEIINAWATSFNGSASFTLDKKLSETRRTLYVWNRNTFGNIQNNLNILQQQLSDLEQPHQGRDKTQMVIEVEREIEEWHAREEEFYRKKSRETIFNELDQNTKHFHLQINKRRSRNCIETLKKVDGSWCTGRDNLESILTSHFHSIMSTSNPQTGNSILDLLPQCISEEDNFMLTRVPDEAESTAVLKCMKPWKAPGPDGFPPGFLQTQWTVVKKDVIRMVHDFFQSGKLLKKMNKTNLCLIPRTNLPHTPGD